MYTPNICWDYFYNIFLKRQRTLRTRGGRLKGISSLEEIVGGRFHRDRSNNNETYIWPNVTPVYIYVQKGLAICTAAVHKAAKVHIYTELLSYNDNNMKYGDGRGPWSE